MPRRRKPNVKVVYEGGFKPGNIVVVTSKDVTGTESLIGVVIDPQKWCVDGIPVSTTHKSIPNLCILKSRGDTIISAKGSDG